MAEIHKKSEPWRKIIGVDMAGIEREVVTGRFNLADLGAPIGTFPDPVVASAREELQRLVENDPPRDECVPPHTKEIFDVATFARVVDWIVSEAKRARYDALAASGHSGLVAASAACYRLGVPLIAVRKHDERPKGDSRMVNAILPHKPVRYALVDDFVASGETVARVYCEVQRQFPQATMGGLILYRVRADTPDTRYSYVEDCRQNVARATNSREFAGSLYIHARTDMED